MSSDFTTNLDALEFADDVKRRLGLQSLSLTYSSGENDPSFGSYLYLHSIVVPKSLRKQGVGSLAIRALCAYADAHGMSIVLEPANENDDMGTTSRARLVRFYKRFGFVENKGRNKNWVLSSSAMYRAPSKHPETVRLPDRPLPYFLSPRDGKVVVEALRGSDRAKLTLIERLGYRGYVEVSAVAGDPTRVVAEVFSPRGVPITQRDLVWPAGR